jgi:hypothetical protein
LLVTIPASCLSGAKIAGGPNNYLPALLAMAVFCAPHITSLIRLAGDPRHSWLTSISFAGLLAAITFLTAYANPTHEKTLIRAPTVINDPYHDMIERTAQLQGTVISPEDPTIAWYAKGSIGPNLFLERDRRPVNGDWPAELPAAVLREIQAAGYVIDVQPTRTSGFSLLDEQQLRKLGFSPEPSDKRAGASADSIYRLWKRKG